MTRAEIEAAIYRRLNKSSSPDSTTQTRIREFVNTRMRDLLSMRGMSKLRDVQLTFTATADQALYGFGSGVAKVYRIIDQTNELALAEASPEWYRTIEPNPTSGTSSVWVPYGIQAVMLQPSSSVTSLVVDSTAAGDTNTVYVEYLTAQPSRKRTASTTMTGATAVTVASGLTAPIQVTKFYLSAVAVGEVTLLENSDTGTELARIEIGQTSSRHLRFALWPTPSTAQAYLVEAQRTLNDLAQNTDAPPFDEDFHDVLVYGACLDECLKMDDSRASYFEGLWNDRIKAIYSAVHGQVIPGSGTVGPRSRLGSMYPAGT